MNPIPAASLIRLLALFFGIVIVAGCGQADCRRYHSYVQRAEARDALESWARESVLAREFVLSETHIAGPMGPGRLSLRRGVVAPPPFSDLQSLEIRLIGADPLHPEGVFVGAANYRGLVIAKTDLDAIFASEMLHAHEVLDRASNVP